MDHAQRENRGRAPGPPRRAGGVLDDQREALLDLRAEGRYDSQVLDSVLSRLDVAEIAAVRRTHP